jgi:protein-disulfide isomerase
MLKRSLFFIMAGILAAAPAWAADSNAEFKERLRQALKENPGLILEILEQHRSELYHIARRGAEEDQDRLWRRNLSKALQHPLRVPLDESRPIIGPKGARFTVIEFSDFLCGACAIGAENIARLLKKYPLEVRVQLRHNPSHDFSRQLSLYYEAIGRQDAHKAWRFAEMVFQRQEELRRRKLEAVQEMLGELKVDQDRLSLDLADKSLEEYIKQDDAEADRLKFKSTPTFVINGVAITGAAPVKIFEQVMTLWNQRHAKSAVKSKGGSR